MESKKEQVDYIKNLLIGDKKVMISPMEMTIDEGIEYLTTYCDKVDTVQIDGSNKQNLAKRWEPMYHWAEILFRIDNEKKYYLHIFSDNLDWIKKEILSCISVNPNLEGIFLQVDKLNITKVKTALKNIEIIQKIISEYTLKGGISINLTDLINKEEFTEEVAELTKYHINQITLPIKKTSGKDQLWLNRTSNSLNDVLDILNSNTENKWGIDRGVDKFILEEINEKKNENNLPGMITMGKGLIYV